MANRISEHPGVYLIKRAGTWRARFKDPVSGRLTQIDISRFGALTKALAKEWAIAKSRQLADQQDLLSLRGGEVRLAASIEQFRRAYKDHIAQERDEKSAKSEMMAVKSSFWPWLSAQGLRSSGHITAAVVEGYWNHMAASKVLSNESKKRYVGAARSMLKFGCEKNFIGLEAETVSKILKTFTAKTKPAPRVLEPQDLEAVLELIVDRHKFNQEKLGQPFAQLGPTVLFLMLTGTRLQEALHAQWRGVSFRRKTIRIQHDPESDWRVKTRKDRDIGFSDSPALERLLVALKKEPGPYILTGEDPDKPRYWAGSTWRRWRDRGDLPKINPKDFRSTFASALAMAKHGPKPQAAAKRLGHSIKTAEEYYIDGAIEYEGETVEEWLGIKDKINWAMDQLGW